MNASRENRKAIPVSRALHRGPRGFANLVVERKHDGEIVLDPSPAPVKLPAAGRFHPVNARVCSRQQAHARRRHVNVELKTKPLSEPRQGAQRRGVIPTFKLGNVRL